MPLNLLPVRSSENVTTLFSDDPWLIYRRQLGFLNLFHPEIRAHTLLGERADEREHLVGEAPDVQDVMAVLRLCGGVGLDVQADEFGFGAALFQDVPFVENRRVVYTTG